MEAKDVAREYGTFFVVSHKNQTESNRDPLFGEVESRATTLLL